MRQLSKTSRGDFIGKERARVGGEQVDLNLKTWLSKRFRHWPCCSHRAKWGATPSRMTKRRNGPIALQGSQARAATKVERREADQQSLIEGVDETGPRGDVEPARAFIALQ